MTAMNVASELLWDHCVALVLCSKSTFTMTTVMLPSAQKLTVDLLTTITLEVVPSTRMHRSQRFCHFEMHPASRVL
jgi:hypothetical protein